MRSKLQRRMAFLLALLLLIPGGLAAPAAAAEDPGGNVVWFQDFEDDDYTGWERKSWGHASGHFEISEGDASSGSKFLKFGGRQDAGSQPLLNLTAVLQSNRVYDISLKLRLSEGAGQFHIASKVDSPILGDDIYPWMVGNQPVTADGWTTFSSGAFAIPDATREVLLWIEPAEGNTLLSDLHIDEVRIVDVTPPETEPGEPDQNVIIREDFESGIGGWVRRFGADGIEVTDKDNHTPGGRQSLQTTVSSQFDGALLDVRGKLEQGRQYELSVWAKMAEGQAATLLRISVHNGQNSYVNVSPDVRVTNQGWVKLSGVYTQSAQPGDILSAYVEVAENPGGARTFLLDDFEVKVVGQPATPDPDLTLPSLKEVYEDYFPIGGIMNPWDFQEGERLQMLKKHYSLLTAENFMKPDYAYKSGTREFDLSGQIDLVEQARANGFKVHGHVLVWHAQSPNWLHTQVDESGNPLRDENGNVLYLDRDTALHNLRTHIRTVVETIGDRVISWDVVNEAMNDNPPNPTDWRDSLRRSGWYYAIGPDYLYEAFKAAREVIDEHGWDIELYYNDYNDDNQNKATAIAEMVKELNERYAEETGSDKKLVDGIGMQAHYNLNTNPANVRASIERIIGLGLKVGITELDIMAGTNGALSEEQAIRQGQLYAQLFQLYKEYADHITRVTFWGLDDGTSWRSANSPLLFDSRFQAKPAYYAVIDPDKFLEDHPPASREALQATAAYGTPVIDGEEDEVWSKAEVLPIARYQTAHNGAKGTARVLWDEDNLYVLVHVEDTELDRSSTVAHEQDSIEVFVDETNSKAASYGPGVGQYRVNYENEPSFNPGSISEGFESAVVVNGTNYTVEVKIPFKTIEPSENHKIGFDVQINDAQGGSRRSVANWNDLTGQGWQDPSVFGVLTLVLESPQPEEPGGPEEPGEPEEPGPGPGPGPGYAYVPISTSEPTVNEDGSITIKPTVRNGVAEASLSGSALSNSLGKTEPDASGGKTVVVEIEAADADTVEVKLPAASLDGSEPFVIRLKTPLGEIDIPSNMLEDIDTEDGTVVLSIAKVDVRELDEAVRDRIGDRPAISLNVLAGGKPIAWNNPNAPVTVSIPYEPTAEERANPDRIVVWYIDGEGNATAVPNGRYDTASGAVVFRTTHFSVYAVAYADAAFSDIAGVAWAKRAIEAMASRGLIAGSGEGVFRPFDPVSRAEFVAMLVRLLELQGGDENGAVFTDVPASHSLLAELANAKRLGIIRGDADGRFHPDAFVTRQEMMVMVDRALAVAGRPLPAGGSLDAFSDADAVAGYAANSVKKLVAAGIVQGSGGKLAPGSALTRAEAAVILYRIWSR